MSDMRKFLAKVPDDAHYVIVIWPTDEQAAVSWVGVSDTQAESMLREMANEIARQRKTRRVN